MIRLQATTSNQMQPANTRSSAVVVSFTSTWSKTKVLDDLTLDLMMALVEKSQGVKVKFRPEGTMNVCATFASSPSSSCQDVQQACQPSRWHCEVHQSLVSLGFILWGARTGMKFISKVVEMFHSDQKKVDLMVALGVKVNEFIRIRRKHALGTMNVKQTLVNSCDEC